MASLLDKIEAYLDIFQHKNPELSSNRFIAKDMPIPLNAQPGFTTAHGETKLAMEVFWFPGDKEIRLCIVNSSYTIELSDGENLVDSIPVNFQEFEMFRAELTMRYPESRKLGSGLPVEY